MQAFSLPVLPARQCCPAPAVSEIFPNDHQLSAHSETGFFTLLVGRLFGVETMTVAKVLAVVTRYITAPVHTVRLIIFVQQFPRCRSGFRIGFSIINSRRSDRCCV